MNGHALARDTTTMASGGAPIDGSGIVPVYNERPTLGALFDQCRVALDPLDIRWEQLLVVVGVQRFTTGLVGEMLVDAGRRVDDDYQRARKIG